jgi:REP element-mobilizing transposase RayT
MPTLRSESYYHIVLRCNRREVLFSTAADRRVLNAIGTDVLQRFDAKLHAYCLMPNHFRMLVQIDNRHLIRALRRVAVHYSVHRQRHLKSSLHVFERPYKAERIESVAEFLELLRNIHLTPALSNDVISPTDYRWSSHRAYLGFKSVAWVTTDYGLSLLAEDKSHARVAYQQFISAGVAANVEDCAEYSGAPNNCDAIASSAAGGFAKRPGQDQGQEKDRSKSRAAARRFLSIY